MSKTITIDFPGLSFLEVKEKYKDYFYEQDWYNEEAFTKEKIPAGRWEVSLRQLEGSFNKTWKEQQNLPAEFDSSETPPLAVMVYAICQHFKDTGEKTFTDYYVRTSSCDSDGARVRVGGFDDKGLLVISYWGSHRSSDLGIAAARKLDSGTLESRVERLEKIVKGISKLLTAQ